MYNTRVKKIEQAALNMQLSQNYTPSKRQNQNSISRDTIQKEWNAIFKQACKKMK